MARYILLPKNKQHSTQSCRFNQVQYRFYHQCIIKKSNYSSFFQLQPFLRDTYRNSIVLIVLKWRFPFSNRIRKAITNFLFVGLSVTRPVGSHAKCNGFLCENETAGNHFISISCFMSEEGGSKQKRKKFLAIKSPRHLRERYAHMKILFSPFFRGH